jgi:hypothetical protein
VNSPIPLCRRCLSLPLGCRSYDFENFSVIFWFSRFPQISLLITCFTHTGFVNVLFGAMIWKLCHYYPLHFTMTRELFHNFRRTRRCVSKIHYFPLFLAYSMVYSMVVDIMVPSHSVIRSHKAADFFVIFGYCDSPATWCWKGESLHWNNTEIF